MYIAKFQVENYKSFLSTQELTLTPGFNVIVGPNNVGKTALVEALGLRFNNNSHRSMKTIPHPEMPSLVTSTVTIAFQLAEAEAGELLMNARSNLRVPLRDGEDPGNEAARFLAMLRSPGVLQCVYQPGNFGLAYLESYSEQANIPSAIGFVVDINKRQLEFTPGRADGSYYGTILANTLHERVYFFKAERLNISQTRFGTQSVLEPDARNLAEVLHNLQTSNPSGFHRFNKNVSIIFPEIKGITVPTGPSNDQVQIRVWSIDPDSEREDLAIPLSESGTGIGQVLAMLYVVLTAKSPRVIIIDEPQSFLNPGAVRKLIEILKQHSQHQFIITTHSPEIVSMTNPKTLFLLRKVEAETITEQLDSTEAKAQQLCLSEVGVRLADVFGADNILWVEGATEEQCFPLIVEKVLHKPLRGTKILGVVQTGDFESKHSELIFQVYNRLSKSSGLIPPAIGFIFDQEGRSKQVQDDLKRRSHGSVAFLSRKMYENYLLNPHAIASVVSYIENFREIPVTPEEVEQWLECNRSDEKYYGRNSSESERTGDGWVQNVHGAKILADIFKDLSECRVEYDKVTYGVALTEWIVENAPDDLAEVIGSRLSPTVS